MWHHGICNRNVDLRQLEQFIPHPKYVMGRETVYMQSDNCFCHGYLYVM